MGVELNAQGRRYLERVRRLVAKLPEVVETESFGHPWFRAGGVHGKMITVFGDIDGQWSLCFKAAKSEVALFLADPRFQKTPYIGQHGWVSLKLGPGAPDWDEIAALLEMSYRNNAPKALVKRLDSEG